MPMLTNNERLAHIMTGNLKKRPPLFSNPEKTEIEYIGNCNNISYM